MDSQTAYPKSSTSGKDQLHSEAHSLNRKGLDENKFEESPEASFGPYRNSSVDFCNAHHTLSGNSGPISDDQSQSALSATNAHIIPNFSLRTPYQQKLSKSGSSNITGVSASSSMVSGRNIQGGFFEPTTGLPTPPLSEGESAGSQSALDLQSLADEIDPISAAYQNIPSSKTLKQAPIIPNINDTSTKHSRKVSEDTIREFKVSSSGRDASEQLSFVPKTPKTPTSPVRNYTSSPNSPRTPRQNLNPSFRFPDVQTPPAAESFPSNSNQIKSAKERHLELVAPWLSQEYNTVAKEPAPPIPRPKSSKTPSAGSPILGVLPESSPVAFRGHSKGVSSDKGKKSVNGHKQRGSGKGHSLSISTKHGRSKSASSSMSSGSVTSMRTHATRRQPSRRQNDTTMLRAPVYTPQKKSEGKKSEDQGEVDKKFLKRGLTLSKSMKSIVLNIGVKEPTMVALEAERRAQSRAEGKKDGRIKLFSGSKKSSAGSSLRSPMSPASSDFEHHTRASE